MSNLTGKWVGTGGLGAATYNLRQVELGNDQVLYWYAHGDQSKPGAYCMDQVAFGAINGDTIGLNFSDLPQMGQPSNDDGTLTVQIVNDNELVCIASKSKKGANGQDYYKGRKWTRA